jgi:glycosyltransferase involved in cell wall biosynthesis
VEVTLWVDALQPQLSGIGRYCWELCKGLPRHPALDRVHFYGRGTLLDRPEELLSGGVTRRRRPRWLRRWTRWSDRRRLAGSLFHGPNYFLPPFVERGVVTVHDLSVFRFPETHPAERVKQFEREFDSAIARAAHVITDTETVREELLQSCSLPADRVSAVPLGVDPAFRPRPRETLAAPLAAFGLAPGAYALCVSTLEPRKKIGELLAAWRRLPPPLRDRFPLVLAGGAGWRNEAVLEDIARGTAEGWLRHLGFVPEADLPLLYAGAALFLYPSTYEGFGLPPLEAMASGVPVVVSSSSCLPEVCGSAALYCRPDDPDDLFEAARRGLEDSAWQSSASALGLDRAAAFSWQRCIDGTAAAYSRASAA